MGVVSMDIVLWSFAVLGLVAVVVFLWAVFVPVAEEPVDNLTLAKVEVELHRISRKLDLALHAAQVRSDTAELKRHLRDELRGSDRA
jgi:hypothetical protein